MKHRLLVSFLIIVILGLAGYTFIATDEARHPFGTSDLAGFSYLGMPVSDCDTCAFEILYRTQDPDGSCRVAQIVTNTTRGVMMGDDVTERDRDRLRAERVTIQDHQVWFDQDNKNPFSFDMKAYNSFVDLCNVTERQNNEVEAENTAEDLPLVVDNLAVE